MFSVRSTLRSRAAVPATLLQKIATHIVGGAHDLSVVFIADDRSRTLNKRYRDKDKPTNVLAFPLSKTSGEIFINIRKVGREAKNFSRTPRSHILYLFIHACLHLKGFEHGEAMERREKAIMKKYV